MQIYIPTTGSELTLEEPWTFKLHCECRNEALLAAYVLPNVTWKDQKYWDMMRNSRNTRNDPNSGAWHSTYVYRSFTGNCGYVGDEWFTSDPSIDNLFQPRITLPKGTILRVDRIYLRKHLHEYDSLTFIIKETTAPELLGRKKLRFWAKLHDVNEMRIVDPRL